MRIGEPWRILAVAIVVLPAACSESSKPSPDRGNFDTDASAPDKASETSDAAGEPAPNECDPVKQDCPGAGVCAPRCKSAMERFACADEMRGAGGQGAMCSSNTDCKKGTVCIMPSKLPKACYTYCDKADPSTCPSGTVCLETKMSLACGGVQTLTVWMCYPP